MMFIKGNGPGPGCAGHRLQRCCDVFTAFQPLCLGVYKTRTCVPVVLRGVSCARHYTYSPHMHTVVHRDKIMRIHGSGRGSNPLTGLTTCQHQFVFGPWYILAELAGKCQHPLLSTSLVPHEPGVRLRVFSRASFAIQPRPRLRTLLDGAGPQALGKSSPSLA